MTSAATGRGGAAGRAGGAPGRAGRPSVGRWGARGGPAGARQRAHGAAAVVEARGDRGYRARGGRARSGGRTAVVEARGRREWRAKVGRAGRPGSGQPARAAAGARRRWTRGGRPRASAWGGRGRPFFFTISDREFGLRPDLGFGALPRAQIHGPRQRFLFLFFLIICRGPRSTALGKDFLFFLKNSLPRAQIHGPRQRFFIFLKKNSLPRATGQALGKEPSAIFFWFF